MVDYEAVKDFIGYVTHEDNDMPYGGLVEDAPQEAVRAYNLYVEEVKKAEAEGILL